MEFNNFFPISQKKKKLKNSNSKRSLFKILGFKYKNKFIGYNIVKIIWVHLKRKFFQQLRNFKSETTGYQKSMKRSMFSIEYRWECIVPDISRSNSCFTFKVDCKANHLFCKSNESLIDCVEKWTADLLIVFLHFFSMITNNF